MNRKDTIYIIDNDPVRSEKIKVILDFIGKSCKSITVNKRIQSPMEHPDLLIVSTHNFETNLDEYLGKIGFYFPYVPIILLDHKEGYYLGKNVVKCLPFPFSYAQILNALHQCKIKKKIYG